MVRLLLLATALLGWFAAVTVSAPIEQLTSPSALPSRQILILSPGAQLQLSPALKLQPSTIQPLTPIGRIQNGNDQTAILYLTSAPRDPPFDQDKIFTEIIHIFQMWSQIPGGGGGGDKDKDDMDNADGSSVLALQSSQDQKPERIEFNPEAEIIPQGGLTPASTVPLPPNNRRFYTIAGSPQFFGNFDFLQNPIHPIFSLQSLEPIKARSVVNLNKGINENNPVLVQQFPSSNLLPSGLPLRSGESLPTALPLRLGVAQPTQFVDSEQRPGVAAQRFAQFLVEQKVLHPEQNNIQSGARPGVAAQEFVQLLGQAQAVAPSSSNIGLRTDAENNNEDSPTRVSDDPSIAQARPVAIAITGKGGLAQSSPIGTAIVGEDGYALSAPSATAIAGDFPLDKALPPGSEVNKLKKQ